jgi:hypothetical protein
MQTEAESACRLNFIVCHCVHSVAFAPTPDDRPTDRCLSARLLQHVSLRMSERERDEVISEHHALQPSRCQYFSITWNDDVMMCALENHKLLPTCDRYQSPVFPVSSHINMQVFGADPADSRQFFAIKGRACPSQSISSHRCISSTVPSSKVQLSSTQVRVSLPAAFNSSSPSQIANVQPPKSQSQSPFRSRQ